MGASGKRVSWVELYLDLVFVLAITQLARLMIDEPHLATVWIALGLFLALGWTWVGFAVLYNRHGADERGQRLLFLVASVPIGTAAVAVAPVAHGDSTVFALSVAATRVVLAIAHAREYGPRRPPADLLRPRMVRVSLISTVLFIGSVWAPAPYRYLLWALAIAQESRAVLSGDRDAAHTPPNVYHPGAPDPGDAAAGLLDVDHFAERVGLLIMILLGELVVEGGQGHTGGEPNSASMWIADVAAIALAGALWWAYFDVSAEFSRRVLHLTRASPTIGRAIFTADHTVSAFGLLIVAAGVGLLLEERHPPVLAYWLACVGAGMYLALTHIVTDVFTRVRTGWDEAGRGVALVVTFAFGVLHLLLGPHPYLWALAAWVIVCVGVPTVLSR